ncbi:sialidase family protein [Actinopolymorpha rutila]|uniref:Photosystem II stability/assembly factor-like uncharacterized protein n=1 Tax=Actinopolymorpha rutila TaxID=446787 RepID=A0A852Z409_9ACTN|nr:hypothetical protein [Actinopolymorpha rutila]NYH88117.1 photosystem II stability/assembly factor-like uncharacterized protein [Actinopolymorpha rutila]
MVAVTGLAGLVVADAMFVTMAIRHSAGESVLGTVTQNSKTDNSATDNSAGSPSPGEEPPATPGPSPTSAPASPPVRSRALVDIGAGAAVARATTGKCGRGGATLQLSTDSGRTFDLADIRPAEVIVRLITKDARNTSLIGADADCRKLATYVTTDAGRTWTRLDGTSGNWYLEPRSAPRLHAPTGDAVVPCEKGVDVVGFSTLSSRRAFVLCDGGEVMATGDGGATWSRRGNVKGGADLDFVNERTGLVARTGVPNCDGVLVNRTTDGGRSWKLMACVSGDEARSGDRPDISADGDRAYLVRGEAVWVTTDAGRQWTRAPWGRQSPQGASPSPSSQAVPAG